MTDLAIPIDPAAEAAAERDARPRKRACPSDLAALNGKPRSRPGPRRWDHRGSHCAISGTTWAREIAQELSDAQHRPAYLIVEDALIAYRRGAA